MSSALDNALQSAKKHAEFYQDIAGRGLVPGGGAGSILGQIGSHGYGAAYGTASSLNHHAEQYRHNIGWTFASLRIIYQRIAHQPLRVAKIIKTGKSKADYSSRDRQVMPGHFKRWSQDLEVLETHPLIDVLNVPNEIMLRWSLIAVTVASLELTGKAYWWIYDGPRGSDLEGRRVIWPIPSHWMEAKHTDKRIYDHWDMRPDGVSEATKISRDEIVYWHYPDPSNPLGAISPLQTQARSVVADENIIECQRRYFANDLFPGYAVIVGRNPDLKQVGIPNQRPTLSRDQRNQLITLLKSYYRGVQNFGDPMILDGLIEDIKRIDRTAKELDFLNSGKYTKERVTQGFGVSPITMGQVEGANRASSIMADTLLVTNTLNPKIEFMSEVLTFKVFPCFMGLNPFQPPDHIAYLEEASVKDPDTERSDRESLRSAGGISVNEERFQKGLPPIHGGDVALIPVNVQPVNVVRADDPLPKTPAVMPGTPVGYQSLQEDDQGPADDQPQAQGQNSDSGKCLGMYLSKSAKQDWWLRQQSDCENQLRSNLAALLRQTTEDLLSQLQHHSGNSHFSASLAEHLLDTRQLTRQIKDTCREPLLRAILSGASMEWLMGQEYKKSADDNRVQLSAQIMNEVDKHLNQLMNQSWWHDTAVNIKDQVITAIRTGIEEGQSNDEMVQSIRSVLGDSNPLRARRIALTESAAAVNAGQEVSRRELAEMGLVWGRKWSAILDDATRTAHASADGQEARMGEPFLVGGESCMYPGDLSLSAAQRCNCRCISTTVWMAEKKHAQARNAQAGQGNAAQDRGHQRRG